MTTETAKNPRERFLELIRTAAADFALAAPLSVPRADVQRAIDRVVLSFRAAAVSRPAMYECTPASVARAIALCALTGLMPGGAVPEVDLIPRSSRIKDAEGRWVDGPKELQWQVGWRGYKTLAARAGCLAKPVAVYAEDDWQWEEGLDSTLRHKPRIGGPRLVDNVETLAPLVAVYVVATYPDGRKDFLVMERDQIAKRRDSSDGWKAYKKDQIKSTPWSEWPDEMALKTAMRYAASRGLLLLDDVARYAFDADERADSVAPSATVVDVTPRPQAAEQRPALPDRGGLDDLERDMLGGMNDQRERVRVDEDESSGSILTEAERAREAAREAKKEDKPKKSNKPPKSEDKPAEPKIKDHAMSIERIKAAEANAGDGPVNAARQARGLSMALGTVALLAALETDAAVDEYVRAVNGGA